MSYYSAVCISPLLSCPLEDIFIHYEREHDDQQFLSSLQRKILSLDKHDDEDPENVIPTLLIRPSDGSSGLFAYHNPTINRTNPPNIRATRLAMACGLFAMRFHGTVLIFQRPQKKEAFTAAQLEMACCGSPDLRSSILSSLGMKNSNAPRWLLQAAQSNYHDQAVVQKLASVMQNRNGSSEEEEESDDEVQVTRAKQQPCGDRERREFVSSVPLCLHCRRPAKELCPGCHGVYFCNDMCRQEGWPHECFCATFRLYTGRRIELSTFDHINEWARRLVDREFQLSVNPYEQFLAEHGITRETCSSWWRTEMDGWAGGSSESAQAVDVTKRKTYEEGFYPVTFELPREESLNDSIYTTWRNKNELGFLRLQSWQDYYLLRGIPESSIVALLMTFPLTLYNLIVEYGQVPCMVAQMLDRPLRIHIVGAEKELNFLDIFREVVFLLPHDVSLQLVFVVRQDMIPEKLKSNMANELEIPFHERLVVTLVAGTYGDSLDPDFDCHGSPDIVVAFNAGLFAYPSWRNVVEYLHRKPSVIGMFTDYNEMSGAQCASLGDSRESVQINPFRQPRAMPVYSMNLPQFSNGFIYVFNPQTLD
ncbi:hypothetical protein FisN_2Lh410 [Fistulifera solaris]|uniref:MYND-type domain-containing protein n=1 Tax=Fistulifera solaris TaxID=1519565 RepID=A0A1Z5JPU4_FISSO|nr:hypothetical protein FisN_2Lh410 [Fistulifera solaris]|eukprot:GAX15862.1 hypothetical protein FisN_2Lh410 [Fistulifera solaris]